MTEDGNGETDLKVVLGHQGPDHPVKPVNYGKEFAFRENSNYNEVSPHQSEWPSSKKSTNDKYWRECGEKGTDTVTMGNCMEIPLKTINLPYDQQGLPRLG